MKPRAIAVIVIAICLATAAAAEAAQPSRGSGQEEFDRHYIGFDDVGTFDPGTGIFYKATEPYEGKYKKPMAPVEFYQRIGREDLAQEYTAREARRTGLMATGAVIGLGSLVASAIIATNALSGGNCDVNNQAAFGQCLSEKSSRADSGLVTAGIVGIGGGLVGGALMLAAASIDPNPIDAWQMRELADEYNQRLRQRLGISVRPLASPDTAGLTLDMNF